MSKKYKLVPVEPTIEMLAELGFNGDHELAVGHAAICADLEALYRAMLATAPDVQGEPVAWTGWGCQYPGKMPRLYGERRLAELNCDWESGDRVLYFTAAPQTAPDTALVEAFVAETAAKAEAAELAGALDEMIKAADVASWGGYFPTDAITRAVDALAAYRKGGET